MVSGLFKRDYGTMVAQGVELTPDDIIRLNALACRVKFSKSPNGSVHRQRVCILDGFTFREPTIAHDMWTERVGEYMDFSARRTFLFVQLYALSMDWRDLPDPLRYKKVTKAVWSFARRLICYTEERLVDVLEYVIYGNCWTEGEFGPSRQKEANADDYARTNGSAVVGFMADGIAKPLRLTLEEARTLTASQIAEMVVRAEMADGTYNADAARNRAMAEYARARDEIMSRSAREGRRSDEKLQQESEL